MLEDIETELVFLDSHASRSGTEDTEADCSAAPGGQSTGLGITRAGLSTTRCRKLATWTVCLVIINCGVSYYQGKYIINIDFNNWVLSF